MDEKDRTTRREWMAKALMGLGLSVSYGVLGVQGVMFLLPRRIKPKTRKLFAGQVGQFKVGTVQSFYDLQGNEILVRRSGSGFQAFSSVCPHLGCRVQWEEDEQRFFCPCHRGVFNPDGVSTSGPPADGKQKLSNVPLEVDESSGVIYIEVKDVKRRST